MKEGWDKQSTTTVFPISNDYLMFIFNFFFVEPIHKYIYVLYVNCTCTLCMYVHEFTSIFGFPNNEDW